MASNPDKDLADNLERIRADIAALSDTVGQLVSDTAGIQASLKRKAATAAKDAVRTGEALMSEAGEIGAEALQAASRTASNAVDNMESQIAKNPLTSVLIALGLGFALGLISRR